MSYTFRCVDAVADAPLLHSWVTQPYASFWGMLSATVDGVVEEYTTIQSSGHHHALLGLDGGVPAFLMEEYRPSASPLAAAYAVQDGDIGYAKMRRDIEHRGGAASSLPRAATIAVACGSSRSGR